MKLKYRVKEWQHPFAETYFTAQYKIFGLWLNINSMQVGRLTKPGSVICETLDEAKKRVETHMRNMDRASDWMNRQSSVVWNKDQKKDCYVCESRGIDSRHEPCKSCMLENS